MIDLDPELLGLPLAVLGVAIAVMLPGMGSAKGTAVVGQAGAGVVAEDPAKFGRILIMEILPGTQGVYGLLIGFMLMMNLGLLGSPEPISFAKGLAAFFAAVPIAGVGFISAIAQGKVAAAGAGIITKKPEESAKAIILSVMVETFAIFGLLISMLLVNNLGSLVA